MNPAAQEQAPQKQIIRTTTKVTAIRDITPHLRCFTFQDEIFKTAIDMEPGVNLKIFIPQNDQEPIRRTYTIRNLDIATGELEIEFLLHGDNGPGSAWAMKAEIGDELGIGMKPGRGFNPAGWYLLAGDETAIPAIAAILEALPESTRGFAFLEADSSADIFTIHTRSDVRIQWLTRKGIPAAESTLLFDAVKATEFPAPGFETRLLWAAAEANAVKNIRSYAKDELQLDKTELKATVYWTAGVSES